MNVVVSRKQATPRSHGKCTKSLRHAAPGPFLELFARNMRRGWTQWGDEVPASGDLTKLHALPFAASPEDESEHAYSEQRVLTGLR